LYILSTSAAAAAAAAAAMTHNILQMRIMSEAEKPIARTRSILSQSYYSAAENSFCIMQPKKSKNKCGK
jgi:hypothetical protein